MKELAIRKSKINWLNIINLALSRKDWGKTYLLYSCGDVTISTEMEEFNFSKNKATFIIRLDYTYDKLDCKGISWGNYIRVEYFLDNFTVEDFKGIINRKIISLLNNILESRTKQIAASKYNSLRIYNFEIKEQQIEENGYLDDFNVIQNLENEDLQDYCLDELKDQVADEINKTYDNLVETYCANFPVIIPNITKIKEMLEAKK